MMLDMKWVAYSLCMMIMTWVVGDDDDAFFLRDKRSRYNMFMAENNIFLVKKQETWVEKWSSWFFS